mgnify:FL=1
MLLSQITVHFTSFVISFILSFTNIGCNSRTNTTTVPVLSEQKSNTDILPGAFRFDKYLPLIIGK